MSITGTEYIHPFRQADLYLSLSIHQAGGDSKSQVQQAGPNAPKIYDVDAKGMIDSEFKVGKSSDLPLSAFRPINSK